MKIHFMLLVFHIYKLSEIKILRHVIASFMLLYSLNTLLTEIMLV